MRRSPGTARLRSTDAVGAWDHRGAEVGAPAKTAERGPGGGGCRHWDRKVLSATPLKLCCAPPAQPYVMALLYPALSPSSMLESHLLPSPVTGSPRRRKGGGPGVAHGLARGLFLS